MKVGLVVKAKDDVDVEKSPPKKKIYKDSGVKKLIVLFMGQDIPESYFNELRKYYILPWVLFTY